MEGSGDYGSTPGCMVEPLREYALQLSEVIVQQHQARQKELAQWQAEREGLLEEVADQQHSLALVREEQAESCRAEVKLEQELKAERRRRIDVEARLLSAELWRNEAHAADRAARAVQSRMSAAAGAEAEEAREWKRRAEALKRREEQLLKGEAQAQQRAREAQQELQSHLREAERRMAEHEVRLRTSEAEVLSEGWKMSGELRAELDACARQGGGQAQRATPKVAPGPKESSDRGGARKALQELRELRQRYASLLSHQGE